jgi:hypothetical protein
MEKCETGNKIKSINNTTPGRGFSSRVVLDFQRADNKKRRLKDGSFSEM